MHDRSMLGLMWVAIINVRVLGCMLACVSLVCESSNSV